MSDQDQQYPHPPVYGQVPPAQGGMPRPMPMKMPMKMPPRPMGYPMPAGMKMPPRPMGYPMPQPAMGQMPVPPVEEPPLPQRELSGCLLFGAREPGGCDGGVP